MTGDAAAGAAVTHPAFAGPDHTPHPLHRDATNDWIDANCYTDLWIELLHGLGLDPHPVLPTALGVDYEGDQWTFFKPPPEDLRALYGIELIELTAYRPLCEHAAAQLRRGHIPILEADAYHLPDAATTYRRAHSKTTIAVVDVDPAARTVRYLHNSGCFAARDEDYDGLFRVGGGTPADGVLPPYLEAAKLSGLWYAGREQSVRVAVDRAVECVSWPGRAAAMDSFLAAFPGDLQAIPRGDLIRFDGYAFATLRQLGAACALGARFLRWLDGAAGLGLGDAATSLDRLSQCAKRLILKAARSVATGRPLDGDDTFADMTTDWRHVGERIRAAAGPAAVSRVEGGRGGAR